MPSLAKARTAEAAAGSIYLSKVYGWMCAGLLATAATAWLVANSETLMAYALSMPIMIGLCAAELVMVFILSSRADRLAAGTATMLFMAFAVLNGATLSSVCLVYTGESLASAFLITAGSFGAMSVYGTVTKRDLSGLGSFLFMGLIGLIIASVVNFFLHSGPMQFFISIAGVVIFTLYTAYDTQKVMRMARTAPEGDEELLQRGAIQGALVLYLDFINLFLHILSIIGNRR